MTFTTRCAPRRETWQWDEPRTELITSYCALGLGLASLAAAIMVAWL